MHDLLKAIKDLINTSSSLSSIQNRVYYGVVGNTEVEDGPYCVTQIISNEPADLSLGFYGFATTISLDNTAIQFSIYSTTANTTNDLIEKLILVFQNTALTLAGGGKAYGNRGSIGLGRAGKSKNGSEVFMGFVTIEFKYDGP